MPPEATIQGKGHSLLNYNSSKDKEWQYKHVFFSYMQDLKIRSTYAAEHKNEEEQCWRSHYKREMTYCRLQ